MAVIKTNGKTFLEENEKRNATSSGMINFEEDQENLAVQMNKLTRKDLIEQEKNKPIESKDIEVNVNRLEKLGIIKEGY